ncbi:hypothetical protein ABR32_10605 [Enterobacter cloacae subsp. dissolvens]|nr:hypothetical protein ABR32_10605 [Enterobacter cloacae subsp. dissolvens]
MVRGGGVKTLWLFLASIYAAPNTLGGMAGVNGVGVFCATVNVAAGMTVRGGGVKTLWLFLASIYAAPNTLGGMAGVNGVGVFCAAVNVAAGITTLDNTLLATGVGTLLGTM